MIKPANYAENIGDRLPSRAERDAANQLRQALAAYVKSESNHSLNIIGPADDSTEVVLTPALLQLLMDLLSHIGNGDTVNLLPVTQVLTTRQAAGVLNVPHSYLLGLLETGDISYDLVGRHRRVKAENLFEFKHTRDAERAVALDKLAKIDMDLI